MSRIKVLTIFKKLHRTRLNVFRDDQTALEAARREINKYFKKNKSERDPEVIHKMVKLAVDVERELRCNVIQVCQKHDNIYEVRFTPETTLLDNALYKVKPIN